MTTPNAILTASINGGAPVTGYQAISAGQSVQFGLGSSIGVTSWRVDIYSYPTDPVAWPTPAGWTLDPVTLNIYWQGAPGALPPLITQLAADIAHGGEWLPLLTLNGGLGLGVLLDNSMSLEVVLAGSVYDVAWGEQNQRDAKKGYARFFQKDLRVLSTLAAGVGAGVFTSQIITIGSGTNVPNTAIVADNSIADASLHTVSIIALAADQGVDLACTIFLHNTGATAGTKGDAFGGDRRARWKKIGAAAPVSVYDSGATLLGVGGDAGENTSTLSYAVSGTTGVLVQVAGVAGHTNAFATEISAQLRG